MILNAPVWFDEMLVNIIKGIINIAYAVVFVAGIWIIISFIRYIWRKFKDKKEDENFLKAKNNRYFIVAFILSLLCIIVFFYPQKTIPKNYTLNQIYYIDFIGEFLQEKGYQTIDRDILNSNIVIDDEEDLDRFLEIVSKYKCRRTLNNNLWFLEGGVISINALGSTNDKPPRALFFQIGQKGSIIYTGSSTDYIYIIEDENNSLFNEVVEYFNNVVGSELLAEKNVISQQDIREIVYNQLTSEERDSINGTWQDALAQKVILSENMGRIKDEAYIGKEVYLIDFPTNNKFEPNNMVVYASIEDYKLVGYGYVD